MKGEFERRKREERKGGGRLEEEKTGVFCLLLVLVSLTRPPSAGLRPAGCRLGPDSGLVLAIAGASQAKLGGLAWQRPRRVGAAGGGVKALGAEEHHAAVAANSGDGVGGGGDVDGEAVVEAAEEFRAALRATRSHSRNRGDGGGLCGGDELGMHGRRIASGLLGANGRFGG